MNTCQQCGKQVPYSGRGRPRKHCDTCRAWQKHRNEDMTCYWCGNHTHSEWSQYCSPGCRQQGTAYYYPRPERPAPLPPPPEMRQEGPGPYIWHVRNRWLVTLNNQRPDNAGEHETRRCKIIADFGTRTTAEEWATQYTHRHTKEN